MSSKDYSHIFESRYGAFIIWSIFILAFIVVPFLYIPLKFLIGRICRRCRCFAFIRGIQQDGNDVDFDGRPVYSVWDVDYVHLSHSKKKQICQLRAREISKYLDPFSLELSAENMISRHQHGKDGHDRDELCHQEEYSASQETQGKANQSRAATNYVIDASVESSTERSSNEEVTHVCIPPPGYNKNGMRKPMKKPTPNSASKKKRVFGLALFRRESNDANKQAKELSDSDVEDDGTVVKEDDTHHKDDRREVPIFCAVCLGEYETADSVCWSSNTACTHVFHHDCIFQWLKASGKRASKQQRFSENPSVKQVMNFAMECPCCRQSFIDKSVDVGVDGDEENV